MEKEDLELLKKKLSLLSEKEKKLRDQYLSSLGKGEIQGPLVGYPSIDKPGLRYYPDMLFHERKKYNKIMDRLKSVWKNEDEMIEYYGTEIKAQEFFDRIDEIAKSLHAIGIKENDSIVVSLDATPEFLELLLACEKVGCSIKNDLGPVDDIISFINENDEIPYYITQDYITKEDTDKIYNETGIKHIITIDPLFSVKDKSKVRKNNLEELNSRYQKEISRDERNIDFKIFLEKGVNEKEVVPVKEDYPLFSAFTSGTTGKPKEVIHSSETIMGIVNQLSLFPSSKEERDTWLLTLLPPTLVAVVVAMMTFPLADGKKLMLDPYCKLEDIDMEMMYYEPNCWPTIPIFFNVLLDSKRIPKDYDMSYFKLFGFGAEPLHIKYVNEVQNFLEKHNCHAQLGVGYGQSEGGSDFTVTAGVDMLRIGSSGFPLIDTNIAIFKPGTTEELGYNQIGEIAKSGPGIMLGYSDEELTKQVLKEHADGLWVHTGDYGYINDKDGLLYVLGREGIPIYKDKRVFPLGLENKFLTIPEIKEAIVVSGKDRKHEGFERPYLFVVKEENQQEEKVREKIKQVMDEELLEEEKPADIFFLEEKPIKKFKTDRKVLQKKYNL